MSLNLLTRYGLTRSAGAAPVTCETYGVTTVGSVSSTNTSANPLNIYEANAALSVCALRVYVPGALGDCDLSLWLLDGSTWTETTTSDTFSDATTGAHWSEQSITPTNVASGQRFAVMLRRSGSLNVYRNTSMPGAFVFDSNVSFVSGSTSASSPAGSTSTTQWCGTDCKFGVA